MKYYIQNKEVYILDKPLGEGYDLSENNTIDDLKAGKIILLSKKQINFLNSNPNARNEEVFNCCLNTIETPVLSIDQVRRKKIESLIIFDRSKEVNSFILNGVEMWLDKETRMSLMNTVEIFEKSSIQEMTLWTQDVKPRQLKINVLVLKNLLFDLEIYAKSCFDTTSQHKANILELQTIQEIDEYQFEINYPDNPIFNF